MLVIIKPSYLSVSPNSSLPTLLWCHVDALLWQWFPQKVINEKLSEEPNGHLAVCYTFQYSALKIQPTGSTQIDILIYWHRYTFTLIRVPLWAYNVFRTCNSGLVKTSKKSQAVLCMCWKWVKQHLLHWWLAYLSLFLAKWENHWTL